MAPKALLHEEREMVLQRLNTNLGVKFRMLQKLHQSSITFRSNPNRGWKTNPRLC